MQEKDGNLSVSALNCIELESVSLLLLIRKYESDGTPFAGFFGLQFCQCGANSVELSTSALVDIVLVSENFINFCTQIFYTLLQF